MLDAIKCSSCKNLLMPVYNLQHETYGTEYICDGCEHEY